MNAKVMAICNQKGGVGKTTTAVSMSIALAKEGKRVLLVDFDSQGDSTFYLGWHDGDSIENTIASLMRQSISFEEIRTEETILKHDEGIELIPANEKLADVDIALVNVMSRELVLKDCLKDVKAKYDYILLDCPPALGMLTINALAAADSVLIPVEAAPLPAKDMTLLFKTINKVKRGVNPKLMIEGIVVTLVDVRTNIAKEITQQIKEAYGRNVRVFDTVIPRGVTATEATGLGKSIFEYDGSGSVATAYKSLTKEVMENGEKRKSRIKSAGVR